MKRSIVWSYGGGVQTIAILTLIAEGKLPRPDLAIMADTGRERSSTWRYYKQHAEPIFEELEIPFEIAGHDLATVDLYGHNGDLLIPVFTQGGKLPTFCSSEWKKFVVRRRLRELGYGPKKSIVMWMGMSLDEIDRMKADDAKWIHNHYPLIEDHKLRRHECVLQIERFGLPEPPKSACKICPHLDNPEWAELTSSASMPTWLPSTPGLMSDGWRLRRSVIGCWGWRREAGGHCGRKMNFCTGW